MEPACFVMVATNLSWLFKGQLDNFMGNKPLQGYSCDCCALLPERKKGLLDQAKGAIVLMSCL